MARIVSERDWQALPANMRGGCGGSLRDIPAHKGTDSSAISSWTGAALEAIYAEGKAADPVIRAYAESTVAVADIKIAVRSQKTAKSLEFIKRAMAPVPV